MDSVSVQPRRQSALLSSWTDLQHDSHRYRTKVIKIKADLLYREHRGAYTIPES